MSKANNFYETLKNDPQEIIAWAKSEIREYEKLIKLLEGAKPRKGRITKTAARTVRSTGLSKCCNAEVIVVGGDEGTMHWECLKCGEACNIL